MPDYNYNNNNNNNNNNSGCREDQQDMPYH